MKIIHFKKAKIFLIIIAFCSFFQKFINAQEGLELRITGYKDTLLTTEPLILTVELKNNSREEVEVHSLNYTASDLPVWIKYEDEEFIRYRPLFFGSKLMQHTHTILPPGEGNIYQLIVLYNAQGGRDYMLTDGSLKEWIVKDDYVFSKVGKYEVKVKYYDSNIGIHLGSNILKIEVTEPKGIDLEALSLWKGREQALYVQGEGQDSNAIQKLKQLVSLYPDSTYARYAKETLEKPYNILKVIKEYHPPVPEEKKEIVIKGEGDIFDMASDIQEETDVEIIEDNGIFELDYVYKRFGKYSFKAKVEKGDKKEMIEIAKRFLKEALSILKLSKKIAIEEKEGKIYLVPRK